MSSSSGACRAHAVFLKPVSKKINPVLLPHDEPVHVGRSPITRICDTDVSRKQILLKANYDTNTVECVVKGLNDSGCNGLALRKNVTYTFSDGDQLHMILGHYIYEIAFQYENSEEVTTNGEEIVTGEVGSQDITLPTEISGRWEFINDTLLIYTPDVPSRASYVASFDLDGTIITTKSVEKFPADNSDWMLAFDNVKQKLTTLHLEGYRIVIFSNQLKLGKEKHNISGFKRKIENIITKLGVPIQVFLAIQKDDYRKPTLGMWGCFLAKATLGTDIDVNGSFYVGGAAGRRANWAPFKKKDHSIVDRLFAMNINLKFQTPEEFFLGSRPVPFLMPEFDPRAVTFVDQDIPLSEIQEVIVMVGSPGSGKSFFCKNKLVKFDYKYINRDSLGSKLECLQKVEEALGRQESVVIDNTNRDKVTRKPYLDLCKKAGVRCRCFVMDVSDKHCMHNNKFRDLTDKSYALVAELLLNSYRMTFEEPSTKEGFDDVIKIKFNPSFQNKEHEKLYRLFLLEN